jgi:inorganic pyrophosphatase
VDFWKAMTQLVARSLVVVDRPQGSAHPRYPDVIYPLDYGYLAGTQSSDGGGIDVWLGSGNQTHITGVLCIVDTLKHDSEIKVLLGCTSEEMQQIASFVRDNGMGCLLIERPSHEDEP